LHLQIAKSPSLATDIGNGLIGRLSTLCDDPRAWPFHAKDGQGSQDAGIVLVAKIGAGPSTDFRHDQFQGAGRATTATKNGIQTYYKG
jgi:hypothetical protein